MRLKLLAAGLAYAIQRESPDHAKSRISPYSLLSTRVSLPPSTSHHHSARVLSENASFFESGDQRGAKRNVLPPFVTWRSGVRPSLPTTCSSYSPLASERNAIHLPSGDHAGSRSRAAGVWVRLRTSPCSAGTVNSSPRASITARLPEGERSQLWVHFDTLRNSARAAGLSSGTSTWILRGCSPGRSMTHR